MRVIIFSRTFPAYHPKSGQPTHFVEKVLESLYPDIVGWDGFYSLKEKGFDIGLNNIYQPKYHTIRAGNRWKVGDKFSPRVWSGKPYQSKQIIIAPDIEIKKIWDVRVSFSGGYVYAEKPINENSGVLIPVGDLAMNDGLSFKDFESWFNIHQKKKGKTFTGQIICWNDKIEY